MNKKDRSLKDYGLISLRGLAMGAADIVPGVSGGTIAFITGIYEELIDTISSFSLKSLKLLKTDGIKAFWKAINANFLIALVFGIGVSVVSLAKLINYLLLNKQVLLWSFFFGLVAASIFFVGKHVKNWDFGKVIGLLLGAGIAFYVTVLPPMSTSGESWFIFVSGMIAICAMILPGISGSFILLLLGSFQTVISAVKDFDVKVIAIFMGGAVIGLLSFSRLLKWMFEKYHDVTVATLTGFLVGSLNKLWPWKENVKLLYTHSDGRKEFLQSNVLPGDFAGDNQLMYAVVLVLVGAGILFGIEFIAKKMKKA